LEKVLYWFIRDFLQLSNSIVAPEDVKTISRRSDNKRGVSLCARPRHFVNLAGEARMVLGPRLLAQPLGTMYRVAALISNCHTLCDGGGTTEQYFGVGARFTLEWYLDV
jgi:hypothetical protein